MPAPPRKLKDIQRLAAAAIRSPLTADYETRETFSDGRSMAAVAETFIKPNDRLTSLERLEIYNKQYWFRLLDCLYDDYPGLRAILGEEKFNKLCRAYLEKYPSRSFSLRNLGSRLEQFITEQPQNVSPRKKMALDMARFEWAQVVAFDGPENPPLHIDDLLGENPARLRLSVQPYVTLLQLNYPLDDFVIAVKKRESSLRSEASNAVDAPKKKKKSRTIRLPRTEKLTLAVHRHDNMLYYKRLDKAAYTILFALAQGKTIAAACEAGAKIDKKLSPQRVQELFQAWVKLSWLCRRN